MKLKIIRGASLLFALCCVACFIALVPDTAFARGLATTTGMIRFVHAAVGVSPATTTATAQMTQTMTPAIPMGTTGSPGPVDVFVDGQSVATQLAYGAATNYLSIAAGTHMVQFAPAGKGVNAALIQQQVSVTAGSAQTVAVTGGNANAALAVKTFADTNTIAMTTANVTPAELRVYHLSTTLGTINVNVNTTPVVIDLMQGMASRYHTLTPGSATLQVVAQQTNQMQQAQPAQQVMMINQAGQTQPLTLNLQSGVIQSVFLVDTPPTMMSVLAGSATTTATPGMPQTGSDPQLPAPQPWEIAPVLLLLASGTGIGLFFMRRA